MWVFAGKTRGVGRGHGPSRSASRSAATAFVYRDELFLLKHAVVVDPDTSIAERDAARCWLGRSSGMVHPWGSGRVYPTWRDPDLKDWARAYYGANYERLVRVKATYDPGDFFRFRE